MQSSRKSLVVSRWLAKTTCCLAGAFIRPETVRGTWENVEEVLNRREHGEQENSRRDRRHTRDSQALGYEDAIPARLADAGQLLPIGSNRKLMALILRDLCGCSPRPLRFKTFFATSRTMRSRGSSWALTKALEDLQNVVAND